MYRPIILLLIILCISLWIFTYISNNGFFGVENFVDRCSSPLDTEGGQYPGVKRDYLTQFQDDLNGLSKRVATNNPSPGGKQVKNVVDTLREFAMSKLDKQTISDGIDKLGKMATTTQESRSPPSSKNQSGEITKKPVTKCRFLSSYSKYYSCPDKYPTHTGATFGSNGNSGLACNGTKLPVDPAKAYAVIRDGGVKSITVITPGSNYHKPPIIKIKGDGTGAKAKSTLTKDGRLKSIRVINPGSDYRTTPKIVIGSPDGYVYCHLCCSFSE